MFGHARPAEGPDPGASVAGWATGPATAASRAGDAAGEGQTGPLTADREGHDERDDAQGDERPERRRCPPDPYPGGRSRRGRARPAGVRTESVGSLGSDGSSSIGGDRVAGATMAPGALGDHDPVGRSARDACRPRSRCRRARSGRGCSSAAPVTTIVPTAVPSSSRKPSAVEIHHEPPTRTMRPSNVAELVQVHVRDGRRSVAPSSARGRRRRGGARADAPRPRRRRRRPDAGPPCAAADLEVRRGPRQDRRPLVRRRRIRGPHDAGDRRGPALR